MPGILNPQDVQIAARYSVGGFRQRQETGCITASPHGGAVYVPQVEWHSSTVLPLHKEPAASTNCTYYIAYSRFICQVLMEARQSQWYNVAYTITTDSTALMVIANVNAPLPESGSDEE